MAGLSAYPEAADGVSHTGEADLLALSSSEVPLLVHQCFSEPRWTAP
jgi:hypothetical protein